MRKAKVLDKLPSQAQRIRPGDARLPWEIAVLIGSRADGTCPEFFIRADFDRAEKAMVRAGIDPSLVRYRFVQRTDLSGLPYMLYAQADDTREGQE